MATHYNFFKNANNYEFQLYKKALHACGVAIGKEAQTTWQQMNSYGRNPESIVIAKEDAGKKLFFAVGRIMKLQKETGVQFLPKERVELTDDIRFQWCEDFYSDAIDAIQEWRNNQ